MVFAKGSTVDSEEDPGKGGNEIDGGSAVAPAAEATAVDIADSDDDVDNETAVAATVGVSDELAEVTVGSTFPVAGLGIDA